MKKLKQCYFEGIRTISNECRPTLFEQMFVPNSNHLYII